MKVFLLYLLCLALLLFFLYTFFGRITLFVIFVDYLSKKKKKTYNMMGIFLETRQMVFWKDCLGVGYAFFF